MARGSEQARTAATSAQNISGAAGGTASSLYSTLAPQLITQSVAPSGYSPSDIAKMDTAAQESAGGSNAGAVGQGALYSARTRNAGGAADAIAKSSRSAGETLSQGVLGTQLRNADLKQQQRQGAQDSLAKLYGINLGTSVDALGQVAGNVNADTNASNASWNWTKGLGAFADLMNSGAGGYRSIFPK